MHASPRPCRLGRHSRFASFARVGRFGTPLKRPLIGLSLLGLLLLGGGPETREAPLPKPPVKDFEGRTACEVLSVTAGNTLLVRLDGQETTVRLIGTYVPPNGTEADEARAYTQRLLEGESVYVEYDPSWPQRDREDRVWAYVYRAPDGLLVNLELVRLGYARISAAEPFEHQELLRAYERLARANRKGVWRPRSGGQTSDPPSSGPTARPGAKPAVEPRSASDDATVYVTPHGQKYHRQDCRFVGAGATAMTVREARSRGYTPCARCKPPA